MNTNTLRNRAFGLLMACLPMTATLEAQTVIFPQKQQAGKAQLKQKGKNYVLQNKLLKAAFTQNAQGQLLFNGCETLNLQPGTELFTLVLGDSTLVRASEMEVRSLRTEKLTGNKEAVTASQRFDGQAVIAELVKGNLKVEWRAVLRDKSHYLRTELKVQALNDQKMLGISAMHYNVDTLAAGSTPRIVGNTRGAALISNKLFAGLETPTGLNTVTPGTNGPTACMEGHWRRHTTLHAGENWQVSAVVGLVAPGQARRSFLAYSERERAVPWRAMPVYISWYELNIDRNNAKAPDYEGTMTVEQCTDIIKHWNEKFYKPYGKAPVAFVWDDGWDEYGTWKFNPKFPNGFAEPDAEARKMGAGMGAWLGPVGGYGESGTYRRNYWKDRGGMQLSNKAYYNYFVNACTDMIKNYDFRFFKFDGISAQASAVGPDPGDRGLENAEGIISIERDVRLAKPDIFLNTTVGTWASPFWFKFTDAVWRQEADWEVTGVGDDRERWITYRDRLVYQNFVQNSPICPINTLMTHGFILTRFGNVSKTMDYEGIRRELRCAFACGSGMVELYNDYKLMDSIQGGALWADLAACIDWQKRQADVLADSHWVGGNPWDGKQAHIYGWASWNGRKACLTLRNPDSKPQTISLTLREALELPDFVITSLTWKHAFDDQQGLQGLPVGEPVDADRTLQITLPPFSVYILDGQDNRPTNISPLP